MERQFLSGGKNLRKAISVYSVESLLWDIKDMERKKWGWSLIPKPLQEGYIALWGESTFEK